MNKTIVIPAAGLGSRLGSFTKNYSKAMCTLGKMPVISHIINQFDTEDEIIILLGYKGDLLKQVVEACHPEMNIKFVKVDKFEGPGSGLGYSLHCAYEYLQKPFIFWSCDTVLPNFVIPNYNKNWAVVTPSTDNFYSYRHMKLKHRKNNLPSVVGILPKDSDETKDVYSYVGVSYIFNYKKFWEAYDSNKDAFINSGESYGLVNLNQLDAVFCDKWIDTGNRAIFEKYKTEYSKAMTETVLEKPDEAIWFVNNKVIKFHIDSKFIADRVKRFNNMLCEKQTNYGIKLPELISSSKNTYVYKRADGEITSKIINPIMLKDILTRYLNVDIVELSDEEKIAIYNDFYRDKTISRIEKYCNLYEDIDSDCVINGAHCQSAKELIKQIDWNNIALNGIFTNNYHGDFHLENILYNEDADEYIMLDWRQNFGKTDVGDAYYDIAKMWHSLIVNHNMVRDNLFTVTNADKKIINIDIHRSLVDTQCEEALKAFLITSNKYVYHTAELLTAVIFLNIAACHIYPYSKFLFYLGKYMINDFYKNHPELFINNQIKCAYE